MAKCFVDQNALLAVAGMLAAIATGDELEMPTRRKSSCGCNKHFERDERGRFASAPRRFTPRDEMDFGGWGVCECEPREDKNKRFGINVRVDEPCRSDYSSRFEFERDHAKFDRLVDAAEACTWENKSNTAPLHKVNCIRRRIEDGPVMGINLCGETDWF